MHYLYILLQPSARTAKFDNKAAFRKIGDEKEFIV